jgi:hypothetical protein
VPTSAGPTEVQKFVEKWSRAELTERAASHEHFLDLCRLLDQPSPASADATGEDYCFEKYVKVVRSASNSTLLHPLNGCVSNWSGGPSSASGGSVTRWLMRILCGPDATTTSTRPRVSASTCTAD